MTARAVLDRAIAVLFAPPCASCGRTNERPLDGAVCAACWAAVIPLTPPLCARCGDALPSWRVASVTASTCPRCRRHPRPLGRMAAVGGYDGTLRAIVHALKYDGRRSIAPPLGRLMRAAGPAVLEGAHAVVPVPLHPVREWTRGFNQADLLARGLGLPVARLLKRSIATAPQVNLSAAERRRNVRGAFAVRARLRAPRLRGLTLVLVDDVMTTGATLEACARVLEAAGAAEIRALTAARVVSAPR